MSNAEASPSEVGKIDIGKSGQEGVWQHEPTVARTFHEKASLEIAKWVLWIFAGVYAACFVMAFSMLFFVDGVDFDGSMELVKFLLSSMLPLVTLAVGYYLGERKSSSVQSER
jgi:hypothetical protein